VRNIDEDKHRVSSRRLQWVPVTWSYLQISRLVLLLLRYLFITSRRSCIVKTHNPRGRKGNSYLCLETKGEGWQSWILKEISSVWPGRFEWTHWVPMGLENKCNRSGSASRMAVLWKSTKDTGWWCGLGGKCWYGFGVDVTDLNEDEKSDDKRVPGVRDPRGWSEKTEDWYCD
jgi:hypothetical protein